MKIKIITLFFAGCISFALAGCAQSTWLYRVPVQQGNIITPDMLHQLHAGLCKQAVADLLGPPILADMFNNNRWTYEYTLRTQKGRDIEKRLVIYFRNDRVVSMNTHNLPLS